MTEKQQSKLIACTLFTFGVSGASSLLIGNLMPFLRELYGINYQQAGLLLSLPSWGNLAAIFLSGYLPALIGRRRTVLSTSLWMVVGFGIVASGLGGAALLAPACLMLGIARGGNTNFANTMMSTLPGKKSAVGYNLLHAAFAVGAVMAPIALILCTRSSPGGWRAMTVGVTVLCLVQLLVYTKMPLPQEQITGNLKSVDKSFLRSRSFWLGTSILFFYISAEFAVCNWMVTYFKDTGVLSAEVSQLMSSLLWVVMFIGRMIGASIVGRIPRKVILTADGVGVLVFFLVFFFSRTQLPVIIGIMGTGLFMATVYTNALAIGTASIKGNDLGVSTMVLIATAGGILTPALVGMVAERAGIQMGMGVVVAMTVLLLGTILFSVFAGGMDEE